MKLLEEKQDPTDRQGPAFATTQSMEEHSSALLCQSGKKSKSNKTRRVLPVLACILAWNQFHPYTLAEEYPTSGQLLFPESAVRSMESNSLTLNRYTPMEVDGDPVYREQWTLETNMNYISPDALIQFQALDDNVWSYVQYFTDIDGNGEYEWVMDVENQPTWTTLAKGNSLVPIENVADWHKMSNEQIRQLDARVLFRYGVSVEQQREEALGLEYVQSGDIIYCITFSDTPLHLSTEDATRRSYYLKIDGKGWNDPQVLGAYTFEDVEFTDWFFHAVDVCTLEGLFFGTTHSEFSPYEGLTRAMVLQAMYNMHGSPDVYLRDFSDISSEQWYAPALTWALNQGVAGAENGAFRPNDLVTREELAGFLYNYAKSMNQLGTVSGKLSEYADYKEVSSKQTTAMLWVTQNQLMTGDEEGKLNPTSTATRAETAFMLANYLEEYTS